MGFIDPEVSSKFQPELIAGESLLWMGKPNPRVIFHPEDLYIIPFSLLLGGFMIFAAIDELGYGGNCPRNATPNPGFNARWNILFILFTQYMIWGRFIYYGWLKKRTYYAVTNRRVLVVREGWRRETSWMYVSDIPTITREGSMTGTLWFGPKYPLFGAYFNKRRSRSRFRIEAEPVFVDIDDSDSVYRMVMDLRAQATKMPVAEHWH
jgi:hypothetical protein